MARAPTPTVAITEAVRPVASPVDAYVRPSEPARSNMWQVAEALSGFDRDLSGFVQQRQAATAEQDRLRGEAAFHQDNASGYAEGVRQGSIPAFASPAFMEGYKAAQGSVAGTKIAQEFQVAYMQWPGKDGSDPTAFEGFLSSFIAEKTKGITDPKVLKGLLPQLRALQGGMQGQFMRDLDRNVYDGNLKTHAAANSQSIQAYDTDGLGRKTGTDYAGLWGDLMKRREAALKTGVRSEDYDNLLISTIQAEAIRNRDPRLLDLLDKSLPGTTYKISDLPNGRKAKMEATDRLEVLGRQALSEAEHLRNRLDKEAKEKSEADAIEAILKDPNAPIPEELIKRGSKYQGDFPVKILGWQKIIREAGVAEDPQALAELHAEIFNGGGMAAVAKALDRGVLRSAEGIGRATSYVKSVEADKGAKSVLEGPTFRGVMAAIRDRTMDPKLAGNPLDPNSGLTDVGIELQSRYQSLLMEWRLKNPNASELDTLKAQREIGQTVLDTIQVNGEAKPRTIKGEAPAQDQDPMRTPKPGVAPLPARPGDPDQRAMYPTPGQAPGGEWWKAPVRALPGENTAEARARKVWQDQLQPPTIRAIEQDAKARGVPPEDSALRLFRLQNQKRSDAGGDGGVLAQAGDAVGAIAEAVGQFIAPSAQAAQGPQEPPQGGQSVTPEMAADMEALIGTYLRPSEPNVPAKMGAAARPVAQEVMRQAQAAGLNPAAVAAIVWQESGFNPGTRPIGKDGRPLSSATGLFQLLRGDRAQYGVPENAPVATQIAAGIQKTLANWNAAKAALGRDPTPAELYVVHYQGIGAGPAILKNPQAGFVETLNAWGRQHGAGAWGSTVLRANPWLSSIRTNADFIAWAGRKIDPKVSALSSGGFKTASR